MPSGHCLRERHAVGGYAVMNVGRLYMLVGLENAASIPPTVCGAERSRYYIKVWGGGLFHSHLFNLVALTADVETMCGVLHAHALQVEPFNLGLIAFGLDGLNAGGDA